MATYVLLIQLTKNQTVTVGARGEIFLAQGCYLYVGSARKHWEKRVGRHCQKNKKKRWHIDYILGADGASVREVWISEQNRECRTNLALLKIPGVDIPAPRIGSSDCRCPAHFLVTGEGFSPLRKKLKNGPFHPVLLADIYQQPQQTPSASTEKTARSAG
ncbi:MAG: GIY-YIG nuclease family protein [Magnetococcales bacterium]|nr:GIY-YIG nuclease family protein [Magnetococcales bacterium]